MFPDRRGALAGPHQNGQSVATDVNEPNAELRAIYEADQADRVSGFRAGIGDRDEARLHRVLELIDAGELRCADDYFHAALVLHHAPIVDSEERRHGRSYLLAHAFAQRAADLGDARGAWLATASYDRWLMTVGRRAPRVVLITGLPGTGKTTVGRRISDHFRWAFISKDVYKELIFDGLGWSDKAWSLKVSATAYRLMDSMMEEELQAGHSVVVESNFKPELDSERFRALQLRYGAVLVQIVCWAKGDVLIDRYKNRVKSARHPGHVESATLEEAERNLLRGKCEALRLPGRTIEFDTTNLTALDYANLFASIAPPEH
jgi:predicted kinase